MKDQSVQEGMLIQLVAQSDQQAFAALVKMYRSNIFTTALQLLHNRQSAEEVLQDVFLKVWLQRSTLTEIDNFPAWLNTVARNTIYTAFKLSLKEKAMSAASLDDSLDAGYNTADPLLEKEYTLLLHTAISRLPQRQQETYRLIKLEGLKRNEAAEVMGISPETVKYNLDEASRKVRAYCLAQLPLGVLLLLVNIR
ncbi:RNA polymerase sigma factor [Chitinophaga sp. Cy-1792]|uniref:RNA polymerase sigma factor n=1 Tax=Chitinophaga sp. Cy-1792 TaxID=2608339 RepID=UPI0014208F6B|nr:sigma-70 family RNA polymerase sigma factor [Chitinophaga sp. Cy-1792]NIG57571.1 sigma-70 family RNA polymerase sigma factor [Chitinophaga sp. Cy-1792]